MRKPTQVHNTGDNSQTKRKEKRLSQEELLKWWPFDRLDPSRFPTGRRARSVLPTTQHEEAPF